MGQGARVGDGRAADAHFCLIEMSEIKYILFDCMETLVDLKILPMTRDYAHWGFVGSGAELYWDDFDQYVEHFKQAKDILNNTAPIYRESTFEDRFKVICDLNPNLRREKKKCEHVVHLLSSNYNKTYFAQCFVKKDVRKILPSITLNNHRLKSVESKVGLKVLTPAKAG